MTRSLTVDLAAPTVTYTAPSSLQVGAEVDVRPTTSDTDISSYSASGLPSGLSINGTTGAISGTPDTVEADTASVTVTVADNAGNPAEVSITFPMVNAAGALTLNLDTIATDDTVNIAEKTAGLSISGDTGAEAGVSVSVAVGSTTLTTTSADVSGTAEWSVTVPADASYITGTSVDVTVSASKTGFTPPTDVTRSLTVDLAAPSLSSASVSSDGTEIILTFSEAIGSVDRSKITVKSGTTTLTTTADSTSGSTVEITLTTALTSSDTSVTVELSADAVADVAGNGIAAGGEAALVTPILQVIGPPGAPRSPTLSSGDGKVILAWFPPGRDGGRPILRYEYCLETIGRCDQENLWVEIPESAPGEVNHGRYDIARTNGEYTFVYLRAVNDQGAGPKVQLQAMPFAGAPGPPGDFRAEPISETEFRLSWTEPAASSGVTITGYIIDASLDGVSDWRTYDIEVPGVTSYVGGMGSRTRYLRIRTTFEMDTPVTVDGSTFDSGMSEASPVVELETGAVNGDPTLPQIRVEDAFAREGVDEFMHFTVTLQPASTSSVRVEYRTEDVTATTPADYRAKSGALRFEPGETEKTVSVEINDDDVEDSGEVFVLLLSNVAPDDGARLGDEGAAGTIYNDEDVFGGFTLVDAASGTDVGAIEDGATVTLDDPANGSYGIVAGTAPDVEIGSVQLELSGAQTVTRTDGAAPYTLYAEGGGALPPGGYALSATAYAEANGGGDALETRTVSFTVKAAATEPTEDADEEAATNTAATGAPTISGTAKVGETLSASVSDVSDADGLDDASFAYQWIRGSADIEGATDASYTLVSADEGEAIKVRVAFTDDNGHEESLTSAATNAVAPSPQSLTATFGDVPSEHAGEGETFTFGLTFSEEFGLSYQTLRDDAFAVSGGEVRGAGRKQKGSNQSWTIQVEASGHGPVTVTLPETIDCGARGAICTDDDRPLSHSLSATVAGPVGISVGDASVEEGDGAVLAFLVTLSRAAGGTLTVDYATSDGSAQAGVDYTAASGTLTFQAGESSRTIEVALLDDSHDDDGETLTLTLSNPSSGLLTDGEAIGTIENSDPLPRALLARFGRTAAVQVVDQVEERIAAPRQPGFRGRVAGRELRRGMGHELALSFPSRPGGSAGAGGYGVGGYRPMAGSPDPRSAVAGPDGGLHSMGPGSDNLLAGSAFAMNWESHGGMLSFWGRGARSNFAGREGSLGLSGDVRTTMFGADYAKGPLVAGLLMSHSQGLGKYSGAAVGRVASAATGLYPWLGYKATDRVTVWGVAGYGRGDLLLAPDSGRSLESGLSMAMAAAGTRGELIAGGPGGFALAFKADALWVRTAIDGVDGPAGRLKATDAAVTRFRTGLEGSRAYTLAERLSLKPSVEVGLRYDAGDAETGAGMDVSAGLIVSDTSTGLAVDVRVGTLLVHQAEAFRERGVAVSLSYDPTPSTPLGFTAKVTPSRGGQATSGAEALWGRESMTGMAHGSFAEGNRLEGEVGYGMPLGSRFVGTPRVGFTASERGRDYRVGYGLGLLDRRNVQFELGVDAHRREGPMLDGADNRFLGRATLRW